MKMPGSVGTKKAKAVEQLLEELGVGEYIHDTFNAVFCRALAFFFNKIAVSRGWYMYDIQCIGTKLTPALTSSRKQCRSIYIDS